MSAKCIQQPFLPSVSNDWFWLRIQPVDATHWLNLSADSLYNSNRATTAIWSDGIGVKAPYYSSDPICMADDYLSITVECAYYTRATV